MIFCKLPFMNTNICDNIIVKNESPHIPFISETLNCYINKLYSCIQYNAFEIINQKQFSYLYTTPPSYYCNVPVIVAPCIFFTFVEIYRHPQLSYLLNTPICNRHHITPYTNGAPDALTWVRRNFCNDIVNISPVNIVKNNNDYVTKYTDDCKSTVDLITCDIDSPTINVLLQQIAFGLFIQKKGGSFIIKLAETYTKHILDIIVILMNLYSSVIIINTDTCEDLVIEHYLICVKFNGSSEKINSLFYNVLLDTKSALELTIKIPHIIINKIENFNSIVGQNKLFLMNNIINRGNSEIKKTDVYKTDVYKTDKTDEDKNIKKCVAWCDKHYMSCNAIYK